ncbi:DUF3558 family protein [Nocardia sp. NPDC057227]|uniref:DUF3558 family protein n=1 Tax=Nocardia sp. NPDC057227 TaxID=3346056 RepID=UPI00363C6C71
MRKFSRGLVFGIVAPVLVVTGCTAEEGSAGAPAASSASTTSSTAPAPGGSDPVDAPEVPAPDPVDAPETPAPDPGGSDRPASTPPWDPCVISDADLIAQGYRPDSETATTGPGAADLNCRWQLSTGASELTIVSVRWSIDGWRETGRYVDFTPVTVADRQAYRYRAAQDSNRIGCYIGFPAPGGGTIAFVIRNLRSDGVEEPCATATRVSGAFAGYLP